ncbi:hypothetical protein [Saccharopolyspora pogona]|uniref:hypothetical protein n=1 Tax=Saccharopolyspora pogona TaxID=333966 RepID=UPI001CC22F6E|nr:hypothetical protein [Saccharopolyspora pogona]
MEPSDQDREIARIVTVVADLVASVRSEITQRRAAGEDTTWLEQVLAELEPVAQQTHDLEITHAIRNVVTRHGGGPYPPKDLAAIAGIDDIDAVRRVLEEMVAGGLAWHDEPRDD